MSSEVSSITSFIKSVWWLVLLRGVFAIILGIFAFIWPVATAGAVFWVFGVYAIVDGITGIVQAVANREVDPAWGWLLAIGILGVIAGIIVLSFPFAVGTLALLVLLWIIVIWAIVSGIAGIPAAASIAGGGGRTLGIVWSVLSIVFGIVLGVLIFTSTQGALVGLIYVIGAYAVLAGIVLVVVSIQARVGAKRVVDAVRDYQSGATA